MPTRFTNRREAGRYLAEKLMHFAQHSDALVLALPRGGVPVGYEIARILDIPLEIFLVRKLGVPGHDEYAMGAIASGGVVLVNEEVVRRLNIPDHEVEKVITRERMELARREGAYGLHGGDIRGRSVILVDDGLATGASMKVAVQAARQKEPRKVIVAVPVAPASSVPEFQELADEFICVLAPEFFSAVGEWYENFSQTSDAEVQELLAASAPSISR
jgi:putative phosphoribosyl transferase